MTIKPIRTTLDLVNAKRRLSEWLQEDKSGEHDDDIEVLSTLIEQFEKKYSPVAGPTPVAAIKFRMEEMGLSPRQLEPFIGSRARVSEVLSGKRQLSIDMIRSLHEGLGIPYESLISERSKTTSVEQVSAPAIDRLNALGFNIDRERISSFINSSLSHGSSLLRKTRTQRAASKTDQAALLLWQAAVLQKAEALKPSSKFESAKLSAEDLRRIAKMSARADGPLRAIRELTNNGIAVVMLPPLPGTFLDGAAMVATTGNPVIGLTLRHDRIDSFWFTLLHELAHVVLHYAELLSSNMVFVDDLEIQSEDWREREADELARDSLIPENIILQVGWGTDTSQDDLVAIATRARVHLAIVAGRWQRDHQNYKRFSRLIERDTLRPVLFAR
jgi:HTH-type transcriptional regulator/antitoxin HigA